MEDQQVSHHSCLRLLQDKSFVISLLRETINKVVGLNVVVSQLVQTKRKSSRHLVEVGISRKFPSRTTEKGRTGSPQLSRNSDFLPEDGPVTYESPLKEGDCNSSGVPDTTKPLSTTNRLSLNPLFGVSLFCFCTFCCVINETLKSKRLVSNLLSSFRTFVLVDLFQLLK